MEFKLEAVEQETPDHLAKLFFGGIRGESGVDFIVHASGPIGRSQLVVLDIVSLHNEHRNSSVGAAPKHRIAGARSTFAASDISPVVWGRGFYGRHFECRA